MRFFFILLYVISVVFFSSCSKDFDDSGGAVDTPAQVFSSIQVFNAISSSTNLEVLIDGQKINNTNEKLPYGKSLPYRNRYAGNKKVVVISYAGSTQEVHEENIFFEEGLYYSLFITKENGNIVIKSEDDVLRPRVGFIKVRMAHMSYDTHNLVFRSGNSMLKADVKYKDVTNFVEIPMEKNLNFSVDLVSGGIIKIDPNFVFEDQGIYTLMVAGYSKYDKESDQVNVQIIKHSVR